jgi:Ca2+-binding EF-hand superfamily protein
VTEDEFVEYYKVFTEDDVKKAFNELDENHDNVITTDELRPHIDELNLGITPEQVETIIKSVEGGQAVHFEGIIVINYLYTLKSLNKHYLS